VAFVIADKENRARGGPTHYDTRQAKPLSPRQVSGIRRSPGPWHPMVIRPPRDQHPTRGAGEQHKSQIFFSSSLLALRVVCLLIPCRASIASPLSCASQGDPKEEIVRCGGRDACTHGAPTGGGKAGRPMETPARPRAVAVTTPGVRGACPERVVEVARPMVASRFHALRVECASI
jgi:hypothetical protein